MANDVIFLLRFDTRAGEQQIRQFSASASNALRQAFNIEAPSTTLSQALGLKNAISELTTVDKELAAIQKSLAGLNTIQLQKIKSQMFPTGVSDPATGRIIPKPQGHLFESLSREISKQQSKTDTENFINPNRAKGGFFAEHFDTVRNKQSQNNIILTGDALADAQKKVAESLQLRLKKEAELLRQQIVAGAKVNREKGGFIADAQRKQAEDALVNKLTELAGISKQVRTAANKAKGLAALKVKQTEEAMADMLEPFKGSAKAARTEANKAKGQVALDAKIKDAINVVMQTILKEAASQRQRTTSLNKITAKRVELEGRLIRGVATQQERSTLAKLHAREPQTGRGQFDEIAPLAFRKYAADRKARVEAGKRFAAARKAGLVNEGETLEDFSKEGVLEWRKFDKEMKNQHRARKRAATEAFLEAKKEGYLRKGETRADFMEPSILEGRKLTRAKVVGQQDRANLALKDFKDAQLAGLTKDKETYKDFLSKPGQPEELAARRQAAGLPVVPRNVPTPAPAATPKSFKEIREAERAGARAQMSQWNKEFNESGYGKVSAFQRMFSSKKEQSREEFIENKRNIAKHSYSKLGKPNPESALGISPTATRLLALSSVLQPLNAKLGMVAMQAGFAAFSLGAPIAALALLSAAVGGFRDLLVKSVDAAKAAGLETRKYNRATTELAVEMRSFLLILGIKTQQAFEPVIGKVTELFEELEELPWEDMIKGAAAATAALVEVTKWLAWIGKHTLPHDYTRQKLEQMSEQAGLKGSQKVDYGFIDAISDLGTMSKNIFRKGSLYQDTKLMKEIAETKQPPKPEDFVYTPKFDFSSIENLGMMMQKSIFKQEGKDPQTKAIEALPAAIRAQLNGVGVKLSKEDLDAIQKKVPLPAVAG